MSYLDDLSIRAGLCTACEAHKKRRQPIIGMGLFGSPIMVIYDWPGITDDKKHSLLNGRRGKAIKDMLRLARLIPEKLYYSTAIKCYPARSKPEEKEKIFPLKCNTFIREQIAASQPKAVILLGPIALEWVLLHDSDNKLGNFDDWVGKFLIRKDLYKNIKFLPVADPYGLVGMDGEQKLNKNNRAIHRLREYVVAVLKGYEAPILEIKEIKKLHIQMNYNQRDIFEV